MPLKQKDNIYTVAFYNVENLFDIKNNPLTLDDDFTPLGRRHWNKRRYKNKIRKLSTVIAQLGRQKSLYPPVVVGLVEVENARVVQDLIAHKNLRNTMYRYVHYDSPDERGIDVALLYNEHCFELEFSETFPLLLYDKLGNRDYTRDVLLVVGKMNGEQVHIIVNHWPSRRDGAEATKQDRIKAANLVHGIIDKIEKETTNARIIVMGDFNDDPTSESIKQHLITEDLYNPMESLFSKGFGSLHFKGKWNLFDQIIFSRNFLEQSKGKHTFLHAEVFNKRWLQFFKGKLKGNPFRTYIGKWYKGGFSDHFPIYVYFQKNK